MLDDSGQELELCSVGSCRSKDMSDRLVSSTEGDNVVSKHVLRKSKDLSGGSKPV